MFIWNIDKILDAIRNDLFSEDDKLKYYIFTSLISLTIAFESFDFISHSGIIKIVLMISTTIFGIIYVYNKNKQFDGKNFIERTTIFAVPLFCRITLLSIPLGLILGIIVINTDRRDMLDSTYTDLFFSLTITIIMIFWEGHLFSRLSEEEEIETKIE